VDSVTDPDPDPDPQDPHVFGPPGSFYHHATTKMMEMYLQKVISRKNCVKKLVFWGHLEGQSQK
jgi:hypothetical protein